MPDRRSKGGPRPLERTSLRPARGRQTAKISEIGDAIAAAKARRSIKLREVEVALRRAGLIALDEQARALGLSRTTTGKSSVSEAIVKVPSLSQRPLNASSARHACPFQYELRYWN